MTMAMTMTVMVMVMVRTDDDDDDDDGDNEPKLPRPRVPLTSCMGAAGSERSRYRDGNDSASHTPGQYPPRPSRTTLLFGV